MKEYMDGLVLHGIYRHYKDSEHLYRVLGTALDSETKEIRVIYRQLYDGEFPKGEKWSRPKKMFLENVVVDGTEVPRFKFIGMQTPGNDKRRKRKK